MIALLLKDFYSLRTYLLRQFGLMILIYAVVAFSMKSFSILPAMLILTAMMMLVSSIAVDDSSHWDTFALTLPINARDIVRAKYVLFLGSLLGVGFGSTILCAVLDAFTFHEGIGALLAVAVGVCAMYLPVCCICLPLFIKLGAEKARIFMTLVMMIPFFGVVFGVQAFGDQLNAMLANPAPMQIALWLAIAGLALAIMVVVSYSISVKLYESKEF